MLNYLVCYEENNVKKWDMVKDKDRNEFLLELMQRDQINLHSIFIIPTNSILGAIWLWSKTHKSSKVDFWNFFDDYGMKYEKPAPNKTTQKVLDELHGVVKTDAIKAYERTGKLADLPKDLVRKRLDAQAAFSGDLSKTTTNWAAAF